MDFSVLTAFDVCPLCKEKANLVKTSNGPMCCLCYAFELRTSSSFFENECALEYAFEKGEE